MRRFSLTLKLPLLLVLAVALTALSGTALAIFIGRKMIRESAVEANINSVQTYAAAIELYIDNASSLLGSTVIVSSGGAATGNQLADAGAGCASLRRNVPGRNVAQSILGHSRVFEYVMLVHSDGTLCFAEPYELEAETSHRNLAFTSWHKELLIAEETVISDLHISPLTQRPTIVVATPIYGVQGTLIGAWAGGLRLKELSEIGHGSSETGPPARFGHVTDRRGLVIAHQANPSYVENQTDLSSLLPVREALAGRRGAAQYFNPIESEERLVAYMPLTDAGWTVAYAVPTSIVYAPIADLARYLTVVAGGLLIIFDLGGYLAVRRTVRPLKELTIAAQEIGTGDLSQRIKIKSRDEIGQLAGEFNRMVEALAEKDTQLRNRVEQLDETNKELKAFTYSVSHDLRAPVRHIHGYAELLHKSAFSALDLKSRHYLETILDSGRQLTNLIDELLNFSRMGQAEVRKEKLSLDELARKAVKTLSRDAEGRKITWIIDPLPEVYGDSLMLQLVLVNYLSNALKFTRTRAEAKIEIGRLDGGPDEVAVFIRDNGVGFDMRYVDKLFGIFQRLHRADEFEGTGIGLANCRRIIARHGGRTWAEGEVDKGATFYFSLPKSEREVQS